jgi:glycosyltransferase involved in cell wall biosynthesis
MPNALIFSPNFDGHRQVYVFVLTHVLKELGFKIHIAGDTKRIISNSFYIDRLKEIPGMNIIDTSKCVEGGINITPAELLELQNGCNSDLTIFAEADHHISLFVSQISKNKNRFRGRLNGIFLRPFYYYYQTDLFDKLKYLKHLPAKWRNDDRLFHEFFLSRFALLDNALSIDENFVSHHKYFKWLPDVFQQFADLIIQDDRSEQRVWIDKLNDFKEKNKGRFFFLYFGTAQFRRGYDLLLKMAEKSGDCFIHCGLRDSSEKYDYNINELRSSLGKAGRLFETDQYIADPVSIEYFFKSVSHLILPYRNFFGSSGVMLQALSLGIPVLAPENGIMGYRIKKYKLGSTYNDKIPESLNTQLGYFKELDPRSFENSIKIYMKFQTPEQLKKVLNNIFNGTGDPIKQP